MSRLLYYCSVPLKSERTDRFLRQLIWWIVLCEQWPVRISMLLQILEDDDQLRSGEESKLREDMPILHFYQHYVEPLISAGQRNCTDLLWTRYTRVLCLDSDPEVFVSLLRKDEKLITVEDIGWARRFVDQLATKTLFPW